jgi:hypothetical protein
VENAERAEDMALEHSEKTAKIAKTADIVDERSAYLQQVV